MIELNLTIIPWYFCSLVMNVPEQGCKFFDFTVFEKSINFVCLMYVFVFRGGVSEKCRIFVFEKNIANYGPTP